MSPSQVEQRESERSSVSSVSQTLLPRVPKRTPMACQFCRGRKLKCDGNRPSCSNCNRRNLPCQYNAMYVILFFTIDQNQPTIFSSAQR
ncbi:hypothetical protein K443DRAFT_116772 [Laccaria amethystina LaAM-08-1]|uniref:Zn(2)-C6 fungal-type domain-containing protein n=1 Tax=Laccaria amethystina LaAM-08-1 TaxID=1095629 RepID=A0A0C9WY32_9AGAR|nr:hypothetical protein K443DRAFT_116772 [Laccaria amethystina LaAM-08-1]